jgi:thiamine-monophosphate kinase
LRPQELRRRFVLSGGDDYELCFTAPVSAREGVAAAAASCGVPVARVGAIETEAGLRFTDSTGAALDLIPSSFDHFTSQ